MATARTPAPTDAEVRRRCLQLLVQHQPADARRVERATWGLTPHAADTFDYIAAVQRIIECGADAPAAADDSGPERDRQIFESLQDVDLTGEQEAGADEAFIHCRRCGSTKVDWYQRQTRGADEAATTFHRCRDCGKRWRTN